MVDVGLCRSGLPLWFNEHPHLDLDANLDDPKDRSINHRQPRDAEAADRRVHPGKRDFSPRHRALEGTTDWLSSGFARVRVRVTHRDYGYSPSS